ncbi:tetratricopeptide repeat protein [Aquirufa antheringensis]|uniref:Tetratricopeptide repeat protein n=1 Tax=Aquirufa antheringensis TaxID=2516559 RepID=A0A4Q9BGI8_9BACT|nr:tetratricopeptide repeat protein [Aquirufa antheringensis]MCZ2484466.1 tetratricopeptide repeat protein [Aquirufa antheringensis]MCZ2487665.1 tetratricopeptide repeat protein [Aquirufa antheringensis]TBH74328.1 tetratricopeptide repeat protein [Aquirufa antheringensis]
MHRSLVILFLALSTWSCSQFSNKPMAVAFHNVNAKYNAIWQASRLEKELQKKYFAERKESYNSILPIIIPRDSSFKQGNEKDIKELIRKASLVIDRHQNSHFIIDAYLLIARGRLYQNDLKNAIETYKYVNSLDIRPEALLALYEIYLQQQEFSSAEKIEEFLSENPLNTIEKKQFLLLKAYSFQLLNEPIKAVAVLQEAQRYLKKGEEKARISFIMAQLLSDNNQPTLAVENYRSVLNNKPSYDLQLQANLAIHQQEGNLEALLNMLKDPKNEESKSFIYVKIGQYYYGKKDFKKAKENWEKGGENNPNKGELYYQLGSLFAKQMKDYDLAAHYYDSAATYLAASHPDYTKAQKLKKSWGNYSGFAKQISLQDSLLHLANLSPAALHELYLKQQKDTVKTVITRTTAPIFTRRPFNADQQNFYFNNEQARIQGAIEFSNRWGNRTLEDFWNLKNKNTTLAQTVSSTSTAEKTVRKESILEENWLKAIPSTPAAQLKAGKIIEESLFKLGKLARLELGENELANTTLKRLLAEYPSTTYEAEALYVLYLSNEGPTKTSFRSHLFERYPSSYFKTMILKLENGTLAENKEILAQKKYEAAFERFEAGQFAASYEACLFVQQNYPGSKLEDKIVFLMALSKAGLHETAEAKRILEEFVQLFSTSPLAKEASEMLKLMNK